MFGSVAGCFMKCLSFSQFQTAKLIYIYLLFQCQQNFFIESPSILKEIFIQCQIIICLLFISQNPVLDLILISKKKKRVVSSSDNKVCVYSFQSCSLVLEQMQQVSTVAGVMAVVYQTFCTTNSSCLGCFKINLP